MSSLCPCLVSESVAKNGDDETRIAPADASDQPVAKRSVRAPAPWQNVDRESARDRYKDDDEDSEAGGALDGLTYEALADMARDLWHTATRWLLPAEAEEFEAAHDEDIKRMDTLQLREHVEASRSAQRAVDSVLASGSAEPSDVAAVQRSSMKMQSGALHFDGDLFARLLRMSRDGDERILGAPFVSAAKMVPLLMGGLGRTFEFALADLHKKLDIVEKRVQETADEEGTALPETTLQAMVERDIRNKMTHAGKKAAPGSRTLLRLLWFLDFTGALLQRCADDPDGDLKAICTDVYEETLAPRQAWLLRKMARSGMRLVPKKDVFRVRLGTNKMSRDDEQEKLRAWAVEVRSTAEPLWAFMKSKGLEELP